MQAVFSPPLQPSHFDGSTNVGIGSSNSSKKVLNARRQQQRTQSRLFSTFGIILILISAATNNKTHERNNEGELSLFKGKQDTPLGNTSLWVTADRALWQTTISVGQKKRHECCATQHTRTDFPQNLYQAPRSRVKGQAVFFPGLFFRAPR